MINTYNTATINSFNQNQNTDYDLNVNAVRSANTMPVTKNFVGEPSNIEKQNNRLVPNYMRQVYSPYLAPSNGSTTESFLKAKTSFSSNFRHNEMATRYQMTSEIPLKLYKMRRKIDLII